jgi:hypothetical protein
MSNSLETKQADLQARLDSIEHELVEIDSAMTELASEFTGVNGRDLMKQVAQLDARLSELQREKSVALNAVAIVNKQILDEKEQQAQADRRALQATAREHANAIVTLNNEIDTELVRLKEMFERRFSLLGHLASTGVVDQAFVVKLQGKSGPTRAMCAAGLAKYVSVEKVATQSFVPLASVNPILLNIGKDQHDDSSQIREVSLRSNGNGSNGSIPRRHRTTEVIP